MTNRIRFRAAGFDARPHRPSSLRTQAQRNFVAAAGQDNMLRHYEVGSRVETLTPLTLKARDLYENSVVPVREIARLVGVSERTLYKYAPKYDWRGRYAGQGAKPTKPAAAKRRPSRCDAQPRGAGGRFVGRARAHEPVVHGLKALDPDGAGRAAADCTHAKTISDGSITRAQNLRAALSSLRTLTFLVDAVRDLAAIEQADESAALEAQQAAQQQEQETAELRRSLARKLANLAREPADAVSPVETPVIGARIRLLSD